MIEVKQVVKRFGPVCALDHVDMSIHERDHIAILGESGSGKSTLLHVLAGLILPDEGEILADGRLMSQPIHQRSIAMVFQEPTLWNHMTIRANIQFGCMKTDRKKRNEVTEMLAEELGIAELLSRYPNEISGGQARRVAIARALACQRDILLLDEAFSNLDEATKEKTMQVVKNQTAQTTLMMVTHEKEEAHFLCDHIYHMKDGKLG